MVFIPAELVLEIIGFAICRYNLTGLEARQNLLSFCLVSKTFCEMARSYLYSVMDLTWYEPRTKLLCQTVEQNPTLLLHCKSLEVFFSTVIDVSFEQCLQIFNILGMAQNLKRLTIYCSFNFSEGLSMSQVARLCYEHQQKWPESLTKLEELKVDSNPAPIVSVILQLGAGRFNTVTVWGDHMQFTVDHDLHTPPRLIQESAPIYNKTPLWSLCSPERFYLSHHTVPDADSCQTMEQTRAQNTLRKIKKLTIHMNDFYTIDPFDKIDMTKFHFLTTSDVEHLVVKEDFRDFNGVMRMATDTFIGKIVRDALPPLLSKLTIERRGKAYQPSCASHPELVKLGLTHHIKVDPFPARSKKPKRRRITTEEWSKPI